MKPKPVFKYGWSENRRLLGFFYAVSTHATETGFHRFGDERLLAFLSPRLMRTLVYHVRESVPAHAFATTTSAAVQSIVADALVAVSRFAVVRRESLVIETLSAGIQTREDSIEYFELMVMLNEHNVLVCLQSEAPVSEEFWVDKLLQADRLRSLFPDPSLGMR